MVSLAVALCALLAAPASQAFSPQPLVVGHSREACNKQSASELFMSSPSPSQQAPPTIQQLEEDPFMKQVGHSETLVTMLAESIANEKDEESTAMVTNLLKAQLSHSDGIRGFFVTYLTAMGGSSDETNNNTPADETTVPEPLIQAMKDVADPDDLVPLACMNVVMPTGMITMHTDEELSLQSQITAERGVKVLSTLLQIHNDLTESNCRAIAAVASDDESLMEAADAKLVEYWTDFFGKWGYKDLQKRDIAQAMRSVLPDP